MKNETNTLPYQLDLKKLSNKCLKDLTLLRLQNEGEEIPRTIVIRNRVIDYFTVTLKYKEYGNEHGGISCNQLFLNELEYLLQNGIIVYRRKKLKVVEKYRRKR